MIKTTKDGRTIRTGMHYTAFRKYVYFRSAGQCERCLHSLEFGEMQVHHKNGRGMGGGKRNDIPDEVEGLCWSCHGQEHGQ